jgi:nitrate reductase gamma subunit
METWLEWARGPLFRAALVFMLLGLARHVALTVWEAVRVVRAAGNKKVPYSAIFRTTLTWLFPVGKLGNRLFYGMTTLVFHVSIILVPIFLAGHVALWERGLGISWPGLPAIVADVLTIAAVVTCLLLIVQRATARSTRDLARFQDYALPLLIAVPFATGFLVSHPALNPFSYTATMLVHVMSANFLFILVPLTKLSHCVLLPGTQLVSELAWRWPADAGSRVGAALGKEGQPI